MPLKRRGQFLLILKSAMQMTPIFPPSTKPINIPSQSIKNPPESFFSLLWTFFRKVMRVRDNVIIWFGDEKRNIAKPSWNGAMLNMKKFFKTKVNDRAFEQNDERRTSLCSKIRFSRGLRGCRKRRKGKKLQKKSCERRVRFLKKGAEFGNNFYILSEYGQKSRPKKRLFG